MAMLERRPCIDGQCRPPQIVTFTFVVLFFFIVVSLFDLIFFFVAADLWFGRGWVSVSRSGVKRRYGLFGLARTKETPTSQTSDIRAVRGDQFNNKLFYRLEMVLKDGSKKTLISRIGSRELAEGNDTA